MSLWIFGLCMLLSWVVTLGHLSSQGGMVYTDGPLRAFRRPGPARSLALLAGSVAVLASVVAFALWQSTLAGVAFLVILGVFRQWEKSQWEGDVVVSLGKYVPTAAVLLAFLVGRGVARVLGLEEADWLGWQVGCGAMGACFTLAAASKWKKAGAQWFQGAGLQLLISERSIGRPEPLRSLRAWVGASPRLCTFLAVGSFLLEAAGVLYCVPELRWAFAAGGVAMLLGFWVLLGYFEPEWGLVLVAVTALGM